MSIPNMSNSTNHDAKLNALDWAKLVDYWAETVEMWAEMVWAEFVSGAS